uniref:hypothetical protein n=1 Tax=Ruegeria sp. PR1b TaxID=185588 RepID=UPI00146A3E11|nr:hypothetical protein [Ruegeria sp. PR1b]
MIKTATSTAENAAIFAIDQAREALCYLLQTAVFKRTEHQILCECFETLGLLQAQLDMVTAHGGQE